MVIARARGRLGFGVLCGVAIVIVRLLTEARPSHALLQREGGVALSDAPVAAANVHDEVEVGDAEGNQRREREPDAAKEIV